MIILLKAILFDLGDTLIPVQGKPRAFPYAIEVLSHLQSRYNLAIICNATTATLERVKEILREARILEFFDVIIVSTDVGYDKPDERIFEIALERLGVEAREAIMVGNRITTDILGGNRMNMKTVLVKIVDRDREPVTCELEKPTYTISSLKELIPIIQQIEKSPNNRSIELRS